MAIDQKTIARLIQAAKEARAHAHAPESGYTVGAALLSGDTVITGCNIESSSRQFTYCAEQCALLKALEKGLRTFDALAVVTADAQAPCGTCRQLLFEWCGNISIVIANPEKQHKIFELIDLLPHPFKPTPLCH